MTASAHIITAVIGSGVLSLAWAIAQLGWVAGPAVLMAFSFITYFTSSLLADCYRSPDPVTGKRNYTYMDVVRSYLGIHTYPYVISLLFGQDSIWVCFGKMKTLMGYCYFFLFFEYLIYYRR